METPDFEKQVEDIVSDTNYYDYNHPSIVKDMVILLKQAFEQGKSIGLREGYIQGADFGWSIEQDKHYKDCEHE